MMRHLHTANAPHPSLSISKSVTYTRMLLQTLGHDLDDLAGKVLASETLLVVLSQGEPKARASLHPHIDVP